LVHPCQIEEIGEKCALTSNINQDIWRNEISFDKLNIFTNEDGDAAAPPPGLEMSITRQGDYFETARNVGGIFAEEHIGFCKENNIVLL
jgi:hypothetical protein